MLNVFISMGPPYKHKERNIDHSLTLIASPSCALDIYIQSPNVKLPLHTFELLTAKTFTL